MGQPANLNPRIIESLYIEGLMLSDEVRDAFDVANRPVADPEGAARIALSCEALRTTTRMMHGLAWVLNHRAFIKGEITDFQLRRHGRIPANVPEADPERLRLLEPEVQELIRATERFYARLVRLDSGWRAREHLPKPGRPALERLRERLSLGGR